MPIVHSPALPTALRARLPLSNSRPPLQTTVYKHLVDLEKHPLTHARPQPCRQKPGKPPAADRLGAGRRWINAQTGAGRTWLAFLARLRSVRHRGDPDLPQRLCRVRRLRQRGRSGGPICVPRSKLCRRFERSTYPSGRPTRYVRQDRMFRAIYHREQQLQRNVRRSAAFFGWRGQGSRRDK
jgi:hypothetical protein